MYYIYILYVLQYILLTTYIHAYIFISTNKAALKNTSTVLKISVVWDCGQLLCFRANYDTNDTMCEFDIDTNNYATVRDFWHRVNTAMP